MRLLFWNDTPPTHTYTYVHPLSLHDALPCCPAAPRRCTSDALSRRAATPKSPRAAGGRYRHISPRGKPGCGPAAWYRNRDSRNADSFENGGGFGKRRRVDREVGRPSGFAKLVGPARPDDRPRDVRPRQPPRHRELPQDAPRLVTEPVPPRHRYNPRDGP